jgi:Alpha amylase, catalytic domain
VITADYLEGHDDLITLNHSSPRVQEYVREVMLHWLRRGIDGWRLDAAYAVPASFWAVTLAGARQGIIDSVTEPCLVVAGRGRRRVVWTDRVTTAEDTFSGLEASDDVGRGHGLTANASAGGDRPGPIARRGGRTYGDSGGPRCTSWR